MDQIIKVGKSGSFNIPQKMKNSLKLQKDDSLFVFCGKESIIIKKIKTQPLNDRFENLSGKIAGKFKEEKISKDDISRAIQWSRK